METWFKKRFSMTHTSSHPSHFVLHEPPLCVVGSDRGLTPQLQEVALRQLLSRGTADKLLAVL